MKKLSTLLLVLLACIPSLLKAQVPVYSSHPGAEAVLYLDFDGHTVNGTSFNYDGPIVCEPANLSTAQVAEVFNRIAEDYRPFDLNVTTDPAAFAAAPVTKRLRAIFTVSHSWYGNAAGGVALMNSFSWGDGTPCFVFTALFQYNTKQIAEAGSHEVGHTLGLAHQASYDADCGKTSEFNYGAGNGETGWAPIMGVGYYRNFTVWHNGPDPYGCGNTQNDLQVIAGGANGFGFRADDHGNTPATATAAAITQHSFSASGVVSETDDVDLFRFTLVKGSQLQLSALPYSVGSGNTGSDLDLQVDVLDSAQNVVGSYNPGHELSSVLDTVLLAGTYFLRIDGAGNEFAPGYGSLGSYAIQGAVTEIPLPLRKLELRSVTDRSGQKFFWTIDADEQVVSIVLESAAHGDRFQALQVLPADARQTSSSAPATGMQYRLAVQFENGKKHFSNTISLKGRTAVRPNLISNMIGNDIAMVDAPAPFTYAVYEFSGKLLKSGHGAQGRVPVDLSNLNKGFYIMQYVSGREQFVEKFIKQ